MVATIEHMAYGFRKTGQTPGRILTQRSCEEPDTIRALLRVGAEIVSDYSPKFFSVLLKDQYANMHSELLGKLARMDYSEQDITQTILSTKPYQTEDDALAFGVYTSNLVHILTDRNEKKGKGTLIYVCNSTHDSLFHSLKKADTVVLENCEGKFLMGCAGENGQINFIIGKNLKGDYIFHHLGSGGSVGIALGRGIHGDNYSDGAGSNSGRVGVLIGKNIYGNAAFRGIGSGSGRHTAGGRIGVVLGESIIGNNSFDSSAQESGYARIMFGKNIRGDNSFLGSYFNLGTSLLVVGENISGDRQFDMEWFLSKISTLALKNVYGLEDRYAGQYTDQHTHENYFIRTELQQFINDEPVPENTPETYQKILSHFGVDELLMLADSMQDKSGLELVDIANAIYKSYESTCQKRNWKIFDKEEKRRKYVRKKRIEGGEPDEQSTV